MRHSEPDNHFSTIFGGRRERAEVNRIKIIPDTINHKRVPQRRKPEREQLHFVRKKNEINVTKTILMLTQNNHNKMNVTKTILMLTQNNHNTTNVITTILVLTQNNHNTINVTTTILVLTQ